MSKSTHHPAVWCWTRRVATTQEDVWRERLAENISALVVHGRPDARTIRLEIYASRKADAEHLIREFGGTLTHLNVDKILAKSTTPRRPLLLAQGLAVIDEHGTWPSHRPKPAILLRIGGAMAFGTGEHATTATCLRFLHNEASRLSSPWTALDIGTGSGILSITAERLGASHVTAFDNDERAVHAALTNVRRNRCRHITITTGDILRWRPGRARYPIVIANVYSSILCQAAPQIVCAVASHGSLILSGILRTDEKDILDSFVTPTLTLEKVVRRGRWVTMLLRRDRA